jgi:cytochrome P450
LAIVAYVLFTIVNSIVRARQNAAKARKFGCADVPFQKNRLPLGIDQLQRALEADKQQIFPDDLIKRYHEMGVNTWRYSVMGSRTFTTCEPKNIQALLATQFQDFSLGRTRRGNFMPLLGNGIFTSDGKSWEHSRTLMRPQFARDQVSDLGLEERHVQNMMRALEPRGDGWTAPVDLSVLFFRLTLDSATEFLFGESVDSQLAELPGMCPQTGPEKSFAYDFDFSQRMLAQRARFQDRYWLCDGPEFRRSCGRVHEFIDCIVRRALDQDSATKPSSVEAAGEKQKYVFLEALVGQTRDPVELRSQLLHILLAGRDTTASLLGWLFYCLVRNPAIFNKLRAIVLEEFGQYECPAEITFSKLKSCNYLQWCLNETLRMYPVVPINGRRSIRDTTLPTGGGPDGKQKVFIPKDTPVDYSVCLIP